MTGYGKASGSYAQRNYAVDIRTLNGKHTDIRMKLPNHLKAKEIELRSYVLDVVKRGKVDMAITMITTEDDEYGLNIKLIESYFEQLSGLSKKLGITSTDFLQTIIRIPNVITTNEEEISDEEWQTVLKLTDQALDQLQQFRALEGSTIKEDLQHRNEAILALLSEIIPHEDERNQKLRNKLQKSITEHLSNDKVDHNRLEQEIVFYLEKLDIHEEKVRLAKHCEHFTSILQGTESQGKKLGFISQEMGREINTLGSKAQHAPIQKIVVQMKVELDKIREQLANAL